VTRLFYYVGPPSVTFKTIHPLLRLLSISKEVERIVLADILILTRTVPVGTLVDYEQIGPLKLASSFPSIFFLHSTRVLWSEPMTSDKLSRQR